MTSVGILDYKVSLFWSFYECTDDGKNVEQEGVLIHKPMENHLKESLMPYMNLILYILEQHILDFI